METSQLRSASSFDEVFEPLASVVHILVGRDLNHVSGCGVLLDEKHILTLSHVVKTATGDSNAVYVSPFQLGGEPMLAEVERRFSMRGADDGLALLRLTVGVLPTTRLPEFAVPLRYDGKTYIIHHRSYRTGSFDRLKCSFRGSDSDNTFTVQWDAEEEPFAVLSGTPVWCPEVNAFVGLVATTDDGRGIDCFNGPFLCRSYEQLPVRFRVPPSDRPIIRNYQVDDPNADWFGHNATLAGRKLTAEVTEGKDKMFAVRVKYQADVSMEAPRGRYVTFLSYPDVKDGSKDAFELFAEIDSFGVAEQEFKVGMPDFTVAAIGDGGDTKLTIDLSDFPPIGTESSLPPLTSEEAPDLVKIFENALGAEAGKAPSVKPVTSTGLETSVEPDVHSIHREGPAGFSSEYCAVGSRRSLEDKLQVKTFAWRLAELVALRETRLPLAIGLFGNWGSGKSHFMNLMDQRMQSLTPKTDSAGQPIPRPELLGPWCWEIVPVYFNAWHYVDTNLWASLVAHIFESLFTHLTPKPDELKKVQELLEAASGTAARAAEELKIAKGEALRAQDELTAAATAVQAREAAVQGLLQGLQGLRTLLPDLSSAEVREQTAIILGVEKEVKTLDELNEVLVDARSTGRHVRTFWNAFWQSWGWTWRLGWVVGVIAAGCIGQWLRSEWHWVAQGGELRVLIVSVIAPLAPLLPMAKLAMTKVTTALDTMEKWADRAQAAQEEKRRNDPAVIKAEASLSEAKSRQHAALLHLEDAQVRQRQLKEEARNLSPERRISRFIEQRAQSTDYRGQLGLVSLARRDFEELSNLFANDEALNERIKKLLADAENTAEAKQQAEREVKKIEEASRSIDRIVLFVDDLDRCQPEKVVDVLQAVHLLLAFPLFAVVVGVDQRCLRQSLQAQFKGLLSPEPQRNGSAAKSPLVELDGERPATPLDYLEKIFHVPFHLPPMESTGFGDLIEMLTEPPKVVLAESLAEPKGGTPPVTETPPKPTATGIPPVVGTFAPSDQPPSPGGGVDPKVPGRVMPADAGQLTKPPEAVPAANPAGPRPGDSSENAGENPAPAPPVVGSIPLERWERDALKDYHSLIQTPRGATRLLNTYRLVRAGIRKGDDWTNFCGDRKKSGEFRLALLFLAAAAGCPAVVREWFSTLRHNGLEPLSPTAKPGSEWASFAKLHQETLDYLKPALTTERQKDWLNAVERFTF